MYPNNKAKWAGTFVKQQALSLKQTENTNIELLIISGPATGGSYLDYFLGYFKLLKKLYFNKYQFDLVHSHHYYMTLLYKLTFKSLPLVYTMHENNYFVTNSFTRNLLKWCANNASATIVVWKKMLDLFKGHKTHFLPSGVNLEIFDDCDKAQSRKKLNLELIKTYLFFPAPTERLEKNAPFLQKFIVNNPSFIQKNNIEVIWGGNINYIDMPTYMNAADILVSFSDYESDGMTYKEAMACNLPVITFKAGNSDLYFDDQRSGSIITKDEEHLKEKIAYWLQHSSQGRKKLFEIEMDTSSVSLKLVNIYKSLILSDRQ